MNNTEMVDCGVCGRNHENLAQYDCRAFKACPKCGDCYHTSNLSAHVKSCTGEASMNVVVDPGYDEMVFTCTACGREEGVCSADPCAAVKADRRATV